MVYTRLCALPNDTEWNASRDDIRSILVHLGVTVVGRAAHFDAGLTVGRGAKIVQMEEDLSVEDAERKTPFLRLFALKSGEDDLVMRLHQSLSRTVRADVSGEWSPWECDVNVGQHDIVSGGDVLGTVQTSLRFGGDGGPEDEVEFLREAIEDDVLSGLLQWLAATTGTKWRCVLAVN